jgi:hypothetical protein
LNTIHDRVCTTEVEAKKKIHDLDSFPLRECIAAVLSIATKTKEIVAAWAKKHSISDIITSMTDKDLNLFIHLLDVKAIVDPIIVKINMKDLTAP